MSSGAICEWQMEEAEIRAWEPQAESLELTEEVDRIATIIEMGEPDDETPICSLDTLERAKAFLLTQSAKLKEICEIIPPVPAVGFGPDGSVDLHWRRSGWELLVNIPADPGQPAAFYGDDYGTQRTKGTFDPKNFNYGIAMWLMRD